MNTCQVQTHQICGIETHHWHENDRMLVPPAAVTTMALPQKETNKVLSGGTSPFTQAQQFWDILRICKAKTKTPTLLNSIADAGF